MEQWRQAQWSNESIHNGIPVLDKGSHKPFVGSSIRTKCGTGILYRVAQEHGRPIVERMRQSYGRLHPLQSILLEWKRAKEWRTITQRMNSRTNVVYEARQG